MSPLSLQYPAWNLASGVESGASEGTRSNWPGTRHRQVSGGKLKVCGDHAEPTFILVVQYFIFNVYSTPSTLKCFGLVLGPETACQCQDDAKKRVRATTYVPRKRRFEYKKCLSLVTVSDELSPGRGASVTAMLSMNA